MKKKAFSLAVFAVNVAVFMSALFAACWAAWPVLVLRLNTGEAGMVYSLLVGVVFAAVFILATKALMPAVLWVEYRQKISGIPCYPK